MKTKSLLKNSLLLGVFSISSAAWAFEVTNTQSFHSFTSTVAHCTLDDLSQLHLKAAKELCYGDVEQINFTTQVLTSRWGDAQCPLYQESRVTSEYVCKPQSL